MTDKTPTPAAAPASAPTSRRAVRIVLILSLAANLLVAGVVAGGWIAGRGPMALGGFDMTLGPFTDALEPNDREAVRERLRNREDLRPRDRRDRDQALAEFLQAVRSEPFDVAAIEELFAEQRARATSGMSAGQDVLLERLKLMSPAQRAAFADRLVKRLNPGPNGGRP